MTTYLILNLSILALFLIFCLCITKPSKPSTAWLATLTILLILTAVFDSLIIGMGIVGYDATKLLGIYIGNAPIEDFFYAILAAILVPLLWNRIEPKTGETHARDN